MKFILPKPPSLNHIYGFTSQGGFARSYITKAGKDWFVAAAQEIVNAVGNDWKQFEDQISVEIILFTCVNQDVDNIVKPTLDSLAGICLYCQNKFTSRKPCQCGEKLSLVKNDLLVKELKVIKEKVAHKNEEKIIVTIKEIKTV